MSTLTRSGARRGVRTSAAVTIAALVTAPLALAAAPAQAAPAAPAAAAESAVPLSLQWEISERFDSHLSTHVLGDGATEDASTGVITFPGGVGTYDPFTDEASVAYDGSVAGSFAFGGTTYYTVTLADPVVTVAADGTGEISAVVSAWNASTGPSSPEASTDPTRVVVTTFDAGDGWTDGDGVGTLTATPDWAGVLPAGSAEATALGIPSGQPVDGQSFSPDFLGALTPGVRAHFYASGAGSDSQKDPSSFVAQAAPVAPPTVTYSTIGANPTEGLTLSVKGQGFRAVTQPGDNGVYVGLAEAGGLPPVEDREGQDAFAAVDWITPSRITEGAFSSVLNAPTDELDPAKQYAIYTWQAHTHSNESQDTETAVEIDWSQLEAPAPATLTFAGAVAQRYATTSWVGVSVDGVEDGAGTVTLTGVGAAQTATIEFGRAAFRVPAGLKPGAYTARFSLASDGADPVVLTQAFTVYKGQPVLGHSLSTTPTPSRTGNLLVGVAHAGNGAGQVARPAGQAVVRLYTSAGRGVWYSGVKVLSNGTVRLQLPKLAKGSYRLDISYGGSSLTLGASQQRTFTVR
jgi:hypothetical protein